MDNTEQCFPKQHHSIETTSCLLKHDAGRAGGGGRLVCVCWCVEKYLAQSAGYMGLIQSDGIMHNLIWCIQYAAFSNLALGVENYIMRL